MLPLHVYVAAVLLFTHHGYSQKEGESCVIEHTKTLGVCAQATSCQSARRDYQWVQKQSTVQDQHSATAAFFYLLSAATMRSPTKTTKITTTTTKMTTTTTKTTDRCGPITNRQLKIRNESVKKDFETVTISIPKCRYNGDELIVRGKNALPGEFPHMAAIGWPNIEGTYSFLCDGSLISTRYVLTAAHCTNQSNMKDPNPVIVRLGDHNLNPRNTDGASPIEVPIKNIRKHPQYKPPGKYHDIALLELASDIDFSEAIKPACLWNKPDFTGQIRALATGWGFVDLRTMRRSDELQRVHLTLLENEHCNNVFRIEKKQIWADGLTDNQLCAGYLRGEKDTFQGDSGSPLQVVSRENKCIFHLIGVTSFGFKCAQSGSPAVYTRISSYLD